AVPGGTARVALPPGATLNYISPYVPQAGAANEDNAQGFQMLLYRPLYTFGDNGPSVAVNYPLSVANAPAYSNGGKTVTITMKGWKWSDGESVNASDVVFWLNMMRAEPRDYYGYGPSLLPDNLASYRAAGPSTVVLNVKSAVSSTWFTYNQLAEITPMPAAWDVTSPGARAGSGGCATDTAADRWARCAAVYDFMSGQAKRTKSYASNPLWGVVDGPWKLSSFSTARSGPVASFVPNSAYSGGQKPRLAKFTYYAYPGGAAEYEALKAGRLDVGYVPYLHLSPVSGGQVLPSANPLGSGYTLAANDAFGIQYLAMNFNNPRVGPAFRQLYVRQALQETVDQEGMVRAVNRGYGYPTSGGVPSQPSNQWAPAIQNANGGQGPYPFSVANAASLLRGHGWKEVGGVLTCQAPGRSTTECGPGVAGGTRLALTVDYAAGGANFRSEAALLTSDMAQAGIKLSLVPRPFDAIRGEVAPCMPAQARCAWQILSLGGRNFDGPGFEPSGESLFATGASSNAGSYSDPEEDRLINLTHRSDSLTVFQQYATYTADRLPFIWLPDFSTVQAVRGTLAGVAFSPLSTRLPEYWYFTKRPA
ncbi:MAG: ABC transporter substrate-binding protein, partial [Trebonia sp.]